MEVKGWALLRPRPVDKCEGFGGRAGPGLWIKMQVGGRAGQGLWIEVRGLDAGPALRWLVKSSGNGHAVDFLA